MKAIAVFCGASAGKDPVYAEQTKLMGASLGRKGFDIIYGGGHVGLMGVLADAALAQGGRVTGVITEHLLAREVCHTGLSELHVVPSMHERKVLMAQLSDAVLCLPGGYGTLDELFEMMTLAQLGHDHRPIGILNTLGFYDHLLRHLDHLAKEGFLRREHRDMILVEEDINSLIDQMDDFEPMPVTPKWM